MKCFYFLAAILPFTLAAPFSSSMGDGKLEERTAGRGGYNRPEMAAAPQEIGVFEREGQGAKGGAGLDGMNTLVGRSAE